MKKLSLPNVTLCAATSKHIDLTYKAMTRCLDVCDFGDVVMITPKGHFNNDPRFRFEIMDPVSNIAEVAIWQYKNLNRFTSTEFNLMIHWDSWVIDPNAWNPEFLGYDYIGAKWHWHPDMKVGNEGFCLRSKKMLNALASLDYPVGKNFEGDTYICRIIRPWLEKTYGIRYAPEEIADQFAYECSLPNNPTFGFHGLGNMWRHLNDDEMCETISKIDDYVFIERPEIFHTPIKIFYFLRKFHLVKAIKEKFAMHGVIYAE